MKTLVFMTFLFLTLSLGSMQTLTNIDYIGLGYDALKGNPHSDLYDPGFQQAVMELTYEKVYHFEISTSLMIVC